MRPTTMRLIGEQDDPFHPIGPADRYEVKVRSVDDFVVVEAVLLQPWRRDGRVKYRPATWHAEDGATRFVNQPNVLFRWLGDSMEARIERARRRVIRWAEREIRRRRVTYEAVMKCN